MGTIGSSQAGQDALAALTQQIKDSDAGRVVTFTAYTQDVARDAIEQARYIGDLRPNQNRLNAFSLATSTDAEDFYRFNVRFSGNVHLAMLTDSLDPRRNVIESRTAKGLGIQVIQYRGSAHRVVADSDPKSGAAYTLYQQLTGGDGARLNGGKYAIRIYRTDDAPKTREFFYSFQLVGDRHYQDYDTRESEAPAHPKTKSVIEMATTNPAVLMLAQNMDPTLGVQMIAATQAKRLTTSTDGTDPVTHLLDAFA